MYNLPLFPLAAVIGGWFVVPAFYNIFFSPLAKFPGPLFAKISAIPSFYHAVKGDRHVWIWQCFQIYGAKFRFQPNGVLFNSPQGYKNIHSPKANRNALDANTLNTTDIAFYAKKRKLLNLVFTPKSISSVGVFINKYVDRWYELLATSDGYIDDKDWSEPRNISEWLDYLIFDILGDLCFGKSFEIKEPAPNPLKIIPHAVTSYMQFMYPFTKSPLLGFLCWIKPRGFDRFMEIVTPKEIKQYYAFLADSVAQRMKTSKESDMLGLDEKNVRKDMFYYFLQAKDPDTNLPAYNDYLRACLNESMRMTPAGPSELSRAVLKGGAMIDGEFIPEGVDVGISGWSMSYNELHYGDPNIYRPERWIANEETGNTAEEVARLLTGFRPFLSGPGNCVGQNLAMLEMLTIIARTLWRFDVRLAPGFSLGEGDPSLGWGRRNKNQFQLRDAYISIRDGPMLQFRKREI